MSCSPLQVSSRCYGRLLVAAVFGALVGASPAYAILGTFSTTGTYDEQTTDIPGNNAMNAVDIFAAGNNIAIDPTLTPPPAATYAQFQADILNAYNTNKGGVISFDNDTNAIGVGDAQFVALIGSNQATQLTVTRTDGTLNNNSNHNVISGSNYMGLTTASPCTLTFSLPLDVFAITALGRNTAPVMTLTINYADNINGDPNDDFVTFPAQSMGPDQIVADTLFAWKAPAGRVITGVRFVTAAAAFVRYDDMALILANFQPGDVDGDLDVDLVDYGFIRSNFGLSPATKTQGDITGDGVVNLADFQLWKANEQLAVTGAGAPVPEPTGLALAVIGLLAAVRHGRNRRQIVG